MSHWEDDIQLPAKSEDLEYAYLMKGKDSPIVCTREELLRAIGNNKKILYVTTPNHDTFILPGTDYETLQPILNKRIKKLKDSLQLNLLLTLAFGGLLLLMMLTSGDVIGFLTDTSNYLFLLIFGVIPVVNGVYELRELKKIDQTNFQQEAYQIKFDYWMDLKEMNSIYIITGIIAFIAVFQMFYGLSESIQISGLVKEKVRQGEYWRLFTAIILHAGFLHILFNASAMFVIGKMVIRITSFHHFMIVFLASGLLGSVASLYLMPIQTSVGASGGIMGLIGFLLIFGIRLKEKIPRNIVKSMIISVILVAVIGIVAFDIIDNAAHLGGLVGGILLGFLMIKKQKNSIPYPVSPLAKIIGFSSILLFFITVLIVFLSF